MTSTMSSFSAGMAAPTTASSSVSSQAGHGRIHMSTSSTDSTTSASLSTCQSTYPLKLLAPRPLPSQPSNLRIAYMLAYGGGLVSGDQVSLEVEVGEGGRLVLLTQGSTKVFKARPRMTAAGGQGIGVADQQRRAPTGRKVIANDNNSKNGSSSSSSTLLESKTDSLKSLPQAQQQPSAAAKISNIDDDRRPKSAPTPTPGTQEQDPSSSLSSSNIGPGAAAAATVTSRQASDSYSSSSPNASSSLPTSSSSSSSVPPHPTHHAPYSKSTGKSSSSPLSSSSSTLPSSSSPSSPSVTRQRLHAHLAPSSLLVVLPDPVQPFTGSRYVQSQRFMVGRPRPESDRRCEKSEKGSKTANVSSDTANVKVADLRHDVNGRAGEQTQAGHSAIQERGAGNRGESLDPKDEASSSSSAFIPAEAQSKGDATAAPFSSSVAASGVSTPAASLLVLDWFTSGRPLSRSRPPAAPSAKRELLGASANSEQTPEQGKNQGQGHGAGVLEDEWTFDR